MDKATFDLILGGVVVVLSALGLVLGRIGWSKIFKKRAMVATLAVVLCFSSTCAIPVVTNFWAALAVNLWGLEFPLVEALKAAVEPVAEAPTDGHTYGTFRVDQFGNLKLLIRALISGIGWFSIATLSALIWVKRARNEP